MSDLPDPEAWQAYARRVAAAVHDVRADAISVREFEQRLEARPEAVSTDIPCDIINLLYEEPDNPSAEDLADLNSVVDRLESGATYDEILHHLRFLWK